MGAVKGKAGSAERLHELCSVAATPSLRVIPKSHNRTNKKSPTEAGLSRFEMSMLSPDASEFCDDWRSAPVEVIVHAGADDVAIDGSYV
jgi:hypothetical protein